MSSPQEITQLLLAWEQGEQAALDQLLPLVMDELRGIAQRYMRKEKPGHLLQTTALINEAFLRLIDQRQANWQNRAHFFGIAATCMRRVLVDSARAQTRDKRGGKLEHLALSDAPPLPNEKPVDLIALDDALRDLAEQDVRQSRVVELRFFGGLSVEETAAVLGVSVSTVESDWRAAKAWLLLELERK